MKKQQIQKTNKHIESPQIEIQVNTSQQIVKMYSHFLANESKHLR